MTDSVLQKLCLERGYKGLKNKQERLQKLLSESLISGNAGKRLACAIIGRKKT
jgi:hypothetical protein